MIRDRKRKLSEIDDGRDDAKYRPTLLQWPIVTPKEVREEKRRTLAVLCNKIPNLLQSKTPLLKCLLVQNTVCKLRNELVCDIENRYWFDSSSALEPWEDGYLYRKTRYLPMCHFRKDADSVHFHLDRDVLDDEMKWCQHPSWESFPPAPVTVMQLDDVASSAKRLHDLKPLQQESQIGSPARSPFPFTMEYILNSESDFKRCGSPVMSNWIGTSDF